MDSTGTAFAVLQMFGMKELCKTLVTAGGIHDVSNVMTMVPTLHPSFDNLSLWFGATGQGEHEV
jgi:hypothetical protein